MRPPMRDGVTASLTGRTHSQNDPCMIPYGVTRPQGFVWVIWSLITLTCISIYTNVCQCKNLLLKMCEGGRGSIKELFSTSHGPLARYIKMRVAHAPGMPGAFSPSARVCDPDMHHGTCVTHVPWCMPGLLNRGFLWNRWWGKHSWHSWRMCNRNFTYLIRGALNISNYSWFFWMIVFNMMIFINLWLKDFDEGASLAFIPYTLL